MERSIRMHPASGQFVKLHYKIPDFVEYTGEGGAKYGDNPRWVCEHTSGRIDVIRENDLSYEFNSDDDPGRREILGTRHIQFPSDTIHLQPTTGPNPIAEEIAKKRAEMYKSGKVTYDSDTQDFKIATNRVKNIDELLDNLY